MSSELHKGQCQQEESPNHSLAERLLALGIKTSPFDSFLSFYLFRNLPAPSPWVSLILAIIHQIVKSMKQLFHLITFVIKKNPNLLIYQKHLEDEMEQWLVGKAKAEGHTKKNLILVLSFNLSV